MAPATSSRRTVVRLLAWTVVAILAVSMQKAEAELVLHSTMDNADVGAGAGTDDTGSGDFTVYDTAGTAENGTATEDTAPESITSGATGIIGEALDFEGSGAITRRVSYGDVHDHTNSPLGHTVSIWMNPDGANGFPAAKGGSNPEEGWAIFKVSSGVRLRGRPVGGNWADIRRGSGLEAGGWRHFAIVLDDVNFRLIGYIDALGSGLTGTSNSWTITASPNYSSGQLWASTDPLGIGSAYSFGWANAYEGKLDDFAIWNESLTAGEILGLYQVATNAVLNYNAAEFDLLKQVHDTGSGTTEGIAGASGPNLAWTYATGLGSTEGISGSSPSFTLVLNGSAGSGLTSGLAEPTLILTGSDVTENLASGTHVGVFSVSVTNSTFTFSLVSGTGDSGNTSFALPGGTSNLQTAVVFDYEEQTNYSIRVEATETVGGSLVLTNTFTIDINDAVEAWGGVYALAESEPGTAQSVATLQSLPGQNTNVTYSIEAGFQGTSFNSTLIAGGNLSFDTGVTTTEGEEYFVLVKATGLPDNDTNTMLIKVSVAPGAEGVVFVFQ